MPSNNLADWNSLRKTTQRHWLKERSTRVARRATHASTLFKRARRFEAGLELEDNPEVVSLSPVHQQSKAQECDERLRPISIAQLNTSFQHLQGYRTKFSNFEKCCPESILNVIDCFHMLTSNSERAGFTKEAIQEDGLLRQSAKISWKKWLEERSLAADLDLQVRATVASHRQSMNSMDVSKLKVL